MDMKRKNKIFIACVCVCALALLAIFLLDRHDGDDFLRAGTVKAERADIIKPRPDKEETGAVNNVPDESENRSGEKDMVFCTMEAKQCADGSYVGRQGPDCAFALCPSEKKAADELNR